MATPYASAPTLHWPLKFTEKETIIEDLNNKWSVWNINNAGDLSKIAIEDLNYANFMMSYELCRIVVAIVVIVVMHGKGSNSIINGGGELHVSWKR